MCWCVNGYEASLGFWGCSAGLGIANESGLISKRGCLDVFLGKVFAQLADRAGRMTQLWVFPGGPMQECKIRNEVNNEH